MQVLLYRRDGSAIPTRGSAEAAGYDLTADVDVLLYPLTVEKIPTGVFIAQPPGSVCLACCRSGLASKGVHIVNAPGIIDSDYRGELFTLLTYITHPDSAPFAIKKGDRIAQLLFVGPGIVHQDVTFIEVATQGMLGATYRGEGGFGSTGK